MKPRVLQIHPLDNAIVALENLSAGETVQLNGHAWNLISDIPAKHKFAAEALKPGDEVRMYGVLVGKAQSEIPMGGLLSTANLRHATVGYALHDTAKAPWQGPDVSAWQTRSFQGYHRADGSVGTANYWLVIPLVFCENRNVDVLREALVSDLGYDKKHNYRAQTRQLIELYSAGKSVTEILETDLITQPKTVSQRLFPNIDGVKFLTHEGGCGGIRQDAQTLCGLLAGYITHPNVAGATVLSLGCQNAQVSMLMEEIRLRDGDFKKTAGGAGTTKNRQGIGSDCHCLKTNFCGFGGSQSTRTPSCAAIQIMRWFRVRRLRRILWFIRQSCIGSFIGYAGSARRLGYSVGIPRALRRRAGTLRSLRRTGHCAAFRRINDHLQRARKSGWQWI